MGNPTCPVVYADETPCGRKTKHPGSRYCGPCQDWARKHGTPPEDRPRRMRPRGSLRAFLEEAAHAVTDECIIASASGRNRPYYCLNGVQMPASRAVWIMRHGNPGDALVRHTCNGGSGSHGCVNIRHLVLGTKSDNMADMVEAGNSHKGERHPIHKLTEANVHEIRRLLAAGTMHKDIARLFNVSRPTISDVARGATWGWLPHAASDTQDDMRSSAGTV